jgi:putative cell wall-binding protein
MKRIFATLLGVVAIGAVFLGVLLGATATRASADDSSTPPYPTFTQFTGADRYATAILISQRAHPNGAPAVVLATGTDFPDALCASPLAAAYGGPILLTSPAGLSAKLKAELARLAPAQVFLVGFGNQVTTVETGVRQALPGAAVTRISGTNRYETAALVAEALRAKLGSVSRYVLVSGDKFPDALSVAPLAAAKGWPILLAPQAGPLPDATVAEIARLGVDTALVVGTNVSVPATAVERLVGADRYETCALVAGYALKQGSSLAHVAVATGENFPDALVAGPFLAMDDGIILLTRPTVIPAPIMRVIHGPDYYTTGARTFPFERIDLIAVREPIIGEFRQAINALVADAAEPDGSATTARAYTVDSGMVYRSIYTPHDADWFVVKTAPGTSYLLTIEDEDAPFLDVAAVLAQDLSPLATSQAAGDSLGADLPKRVRLGFVATTARTYVSVTGGDLSGDGWFQPYQGFYGMRVDTVALASVYGRVTSISGKPIAHALVQLLGAVSGASNGEVFTDAKGNYRVVGLLPGTYTAECLAQGYKHQFYDHSDWGEHGYGPLTPFVLTGTSAKRIDWTLTPGPMEP